MHTRQIKTFILAIIATLSVTACSSTNGSESVVFPATQQAAIIPATGGPCDNPLIPIKPGATWTYFSTGSPSGDFTYTDTITEIRADGFTLTSQFSDLVHLQEWTCLPEGLRALQPGSGATASLSTQNMTAEFTTLEVTGVTLPVEISSGMQWQYHFNMQGFTAMPGDQQAPSNGTFSLTMQHIGNETITVPAGTFEAVKIQSTTAMEIITDFQGIQVPLSINGSSVIWFAPGVGYIKSIENSDFSDTPYTATTELQSYQIP